MDKILIAEDDASSQTLLKKMLEKWGYHVVVTSNGEQAFLELLKKDAPQMALIDWMMPAMDGLSLCRILRQKPGETPLYLILVTAKGSREDIVQGLDAGANDYIVKPYDSQELMARIKAGFRSLDLQVKLKEYSQNMEKLARERANQLVHADRLATLGVLSASMAHEINNPASFVSINIQVLEENWPVIQKCLDGKGTEEQENRARLIAEEVPAMFREMKSGISRIKSIVDGMKVYPRSDKDTFESISLANCIDDALKMCWNRLKHTLTVDRDIPGGLPPVIANARRIEQVFVNLFINAADALETKHVKDARLFIRIYEENDVLVATVRDNGPGISQKNIKKIFSPFFTTKEAGKGTGLGLLISRGIIKDHGGTLTVKNAEEGGAEFRVTLPVSRPLTRMAQSASSPEGDL